MLVELFRKLDEGGAVFGVYNDRPVIHLPRAIEGLEGELRAHGQALEAIVERWGGGPAGRLLDLYLSGYIPVRTSWELFNTAKKLTAARVIAVDLETTGLNPREDSVRLVSISNELDTYVVDAGAIDTKDIRTALQSLSDGGRVLVFHNAAFDLSFLMHMGIEPAGGAVYDTGVAEQVLLSSERMPTLKALAAHYLKLGIDKTLQRSDWSGELTEEQFRYAALDARVTFLIYKTQVEQLIEEGLYTAARLDFGAIPAAVWMGKNGVPVCTECWVKQMEESVARFEAARAALEEIAPGVNWRSPHQVKRVLNENGVPVDNAQEATLKRYADNPLVAKILEYKTWAKRVDTYGEGWLKFIDEKTGCIHPSWKVFGAATGRMSCSRPNMMQVPRDAYFRSCFRAPEGRVLVKMDFSQIELRLAALYAGDEVMLHAFETGEDLHIKTAAAITGKDPRDIIKEERQLAKAINFGLLYGMGAKGLKAYVFNEYGIELTLEEAEEAQRRFLETYPGIAAWHASAVDGPAVVRTLSGRRRVTNKKTEYLNTPVQGSGADLIKLVLARIYERRNELPGMALVLAVHDEIVLEVSEDMAEGALEFLKGIMLEAADELTGGRVKIEVEGGVYRDWGVTKVVKTK